MTTNQKSTAATSAFICMLLSTALPLCYADSRSYVGAKKCRPCHLKQYTSWNATRMAAALDLLKPGVRADAKRKAKQIPAKTIPTIPAACPAIPQATASQADSSRLRRRRTWPACNVKVATAPTAAFSRS